MKGPRKQLRARADSDSDGDGDSGVRPPAAAAARAPRPGGGGVVVAASSRPAAPPATAAAAGGKVAHLFDDDEEDGAPPSVVAGAGAKRPRSAMDAATSQQLGVAPRKLARADIRPDAAVAPPVPSGASSSGGSGGEYSAERLAQLRAAQAYKFTATADRGDDVATAAAADTAPPPSAAAAAAAALPATSAGGVVEVDADEEMARRAALAKAHREAMRSGGGARPRGSLQFGVGGTGAGATATAAATSRDGLGSVGGKGPDDDSDADEADDDAYYVARSGGGGGGTRRAAGSAAPRLGDAYDDDEDGAGAGSRAGNGGGGGGDDGGFIPLNGSQAARRRPPAATVGTGPTALSAAVAASSVPAALRQLATTAPTVALAVSSREPAEDGGSAADAKLTSWERAQLKRAGPAAASSSSSASSSSLMAKPKAGLSIDEDPAYRFQPATAAAASAANAPGTPSGGPPALPDPSATLDRVLSGLGQAAAQARAAADDDAAEVARLQREAAEAKASMPGLQAAVSAASSAFDLYQGLRLYLGDYVPCAREKAALVDEWEAAEAAHVAAAGAATLAARRAALAADVAAAQAAGLAHVADASAGAAVAPPSQQPDGGAENGGYAPSAGHARWLAAVAQVVAAAVNGSSASGDEDGVIGPAQLQQLEEDVAADDGGNGSGGGAIAESARRLRTASSLLLADVHEAYASVGSALSRFAGWRGHALPSLARTYVDAYAYLALQPLLAPLVRAQLAAAWTPLALPGDAVAGAAASRGGGDDNEPASPPVAAITVDPSLDPGRLEWLGGAMGYGDGARPALQALLAPAAPTPSSPAAQPPPDADAVDEAVATDEGLLPALVSSAALPRVAALLSHPAGVWDPVGSPASLAHAVAAVRELLVFEPPADRVKELLGAVAGGLQAAVLEASVPILAATTSSSSSASPPLTMLAAASLGCWLRGLMLLHAVAAWEGVLAPQLLARLGVGQVVGGLLLPPVRWLAAVAAGGAGGGAPRAATVTSAGAQPALALPPPALRSLAGVLLASVVAAVPAGWLAADGHGSDDGACADAAADVRRLAAQLAAAAGGGPQPGWAAVLAGVAN